MSIYLAFIHPERPSEVADISSFVSNVRWETPCPSVLQGSLLFRRACSFHANLALLVAHSGEVPVRFIYGYRGGTPGLPWREAEFGKVTTDSHNMHWRQVSPERIGQF